MPVCNACRRAIHLCFRTGLSASSTRTLTGTSTSAVNSKWELMLNILLSGEFNFEQFWPPDKRLCRCRLQVARAFPKFDANWNVAQSKP